MLMVVRDQLKNIIFEMAYIKQLIQSLFEDENEGNIESFKKLIYLAVNETNIFSSHALELANTICPILHCIEDSTTKIYALQLLSELATNYQQQIPSDVYDFQQAIALLSDENTEVRKAAHYLLLIFIKKYERIDQIILGYLQKVRESPDQWKQIQKIIHSFQSLLVIEPKCVTYPLDFTHLNNFLRFILGFRTHQHSLIQKASEQTIASFIKNEYTPKILSKLDKSIANEMLQTAERLGVNLNLKPVDNEKKTAEPAKPKKKVSELQMLLESMKRESDWKTKSQIIQDISKRLQGADPWNISEEFIDGMLDYTYDYNFKICITAMNIILNLMQHFPTEVNIKIKKIEDVMVEKICDLKMAVRQIAAKVLRKILDSGSKESPRKILNKLSNCSVVGKQQILNFLQDYYGTVKPSDLNLILSEIACQLQNQNTKIKIKTLDCLVKISVSTNINEAKYILQKKLNKVYYDMFLDRLKERGMPQTKSQRWDDSKNNNINKGMTWQAERSPNYAEPENNKFLTKFQFAKKVERPPPQEDTLYDFKYDAPTFGGFQKKQHKEEKIMLGTSHTSNKTESISEVGRQDDSLVHIASKHAKKAQSYKPSALSISNSIEEYPIEEKKLPLKPKPVKKAPIPANEDFTKEQNTNLVIKSREYQNKNNYEDVEKVEVKPERNIKQMKLTKESVNMPEKSQKTIEQDLNKSAKEPFSIKRSSTKKQGHQIDYKATQYVSKEELAPVTNPKEMLKQILTNLPKDNDWSKQFDSLDGLRRLIKNHEDFYSQIHQNLANIMPEVLKLVESLRSSLAKNAMITLAEMCEALKKSMDPFLESIFVKLFKKAQDTNTFIIEEVNKCIKSLCCYCSNAKICTIVISNSQSKAIPIKLKIALCIKQLLEKDGYRLAIVKENPKIIGVMGCYITDSSQEVRALTRETFLKILDNNNGSEVEGIFRKSPKEVWQKWRSIIDKDLK